MRGFGIGLALGVLIGAASAAYAAQVVGSNGYVIGWTVSIEGEEVCSDPYIWISTKEIECD